ncbi:diacylglycerol kinase [Salisediminibacterium selenitireducens]|uniref:Diacylglycerol kinase catalytic region n=1 Tax=Bacillus selenitireducens (strain ATCC 700615 / DSM 15326 / MLS10) TaxID=439292 RepID=D6XYW9_BACIE|nr:diacylglycerol kinase [Salisediminibacterium selenitireducens]ADH98277.1 diacylglycerol kinase catalytic region [[Bacillus] selenitireducens MLS10]
MKRARLIYNPSSGREQVKKYLPYILENLEKSGYEASAHATTGKDCATKAARTACERGFDLIIAAGGDGTINEVVQGMVNQEHRPALGILPGGTTNDFARALNLPKTIPGACKVIVEGRRVTSDVGQVGDASFINIAAGGTLTELTYEVPSRLKTMIGQLAYYVKGFEKLPRIKPVDVTIHYDGEVFEGEIMLFLVANTNSVGGFEKLAPNATINDGKFDMLILKKTNLADAVRVVTAALRGEHISDDRVIYTQASEILIEPKEEMLLNLDGEYGGKLPSRFVNLKGHIDLMLPNEHLACLGEKNPLEDD